MWNAMCAGLRCTATVLLQPAYGLLIVRYGYNYWCALFTLHYYGMFFMLQQYVHNTFHIIFLYLILPHSLAIINTQ